MKYRIKNRVVKFQNVLVAVRMELRIIILEDLAVNYPRLKSNGSKITEDECEHLLEWMTSFHSHFMSRGDRTFEDLWEKGSYWHLATRAEEWKSMPNGPLKNAAVKIDSELEKCKFKTLIHGDSKLPNFCFGEESVGAVDFQYIGPGCGLIDFCYLFIGIVEENDEAEFISRLLDSYFSKLRIKNKLLSWEELNELENEWRNLLPFVVADYERFLIGWSPGSHWRSTKYSSDLTEKALSLLS